MKDIVFLWQRVTLFAKSMLVNLPLLHEEIFISGQLKTLDVAFINVAKMFVWVISQNSIYSYIFINHSLLFMLTICPCYNTCS